jgi:hypothetical protein
VTSPFAAWMRRKHGAYALLATLLLVGMLLPPLLLALLHASARAPQASWESLQPLAAWQAWSGIPGSVLLWLVPCAALLGVASIVLAFEALVFVLRLDPDDDAWSSLGWFARSWRQWGLAAAVLVTVMVFAGFLLESIPRDSTGIDLTPAVFDLAGFALPWLAWNRRNVRVGPAPVAWRWGWPGGRTLACVFVGLGCLWIVDGGLDRLPDTMPLGFGIAVGGFRWAARVALTIAIAVLWLSDGQLPVRSALRHAVRPLVFLPVALQQLRLGLLVVLALLPLLPIVLTLVFVLPQFEHVLEFPLPAAWEWAVRASRFAIAWWWAAMLAVAAVLLSAYFTLAFAGLGRLLAQLGLARDVRN